MKKLRKTLTAVVALSMIASYVYVPIAKAASLTAVSDTISTSAPSTQANHTVDFTTAVTIEQNGYIEVEFQDANFGTIGAVGDITCGGGGVHSTSTARTAKCLYSGGSLATGTQEIVINNITNPTTGFYNVEIRTYDSGDTLLESAIAVVAIVDTVTVTAHVDSTLTFNVVGLDAGVDVNGFNTTGTTTASTTPFGDLSPTGGNSGRYLLGQQLEVTTNASAGFQVTVTQNSDFQTAAGAIIDSFVDGSATTTPTPWTAPSGDLASSTTWGHIGITTDDSDGLNGLTAYGSDNYTGLTVSSPAVIMAHNGPSSATAVNKGLTKVGYGVQINALQEAGDYETTLTYIATPTY